MGWLLMDNPLFVYYLLTTGMAIFQPAMLFTKSSTILVAGYVPEILLLLLASIINLGCLP